MDTKPGAYPPQLPAAISNPSTGRETPNAPIEFLSWDEHHGDTGTAQQLLDRFPALLQFNEARSKDLHGNTSPELRMPGGSLVHFDSTAELKDYLTRSASPVVPTAAVSATFQGVMGRPPSAQETDQAESAFNNGKSLADYRASLIASPETAGTLRGVSLQVLGRDASTAELGS